VIRSAFWRRCLALSQKCDRFEALQWERNKSSQISFGVPEAIGTMTRCPTCLALMPPTAYRRIIHFLEPRRANHVRLVAPSFSDVPIRSSTQVAIFSSVRGGTRRDAREKSRTAPPRMPAQSTKRVAGSPCAGSLLEFPAVLVFFREVALETPRASHGHPREQ
jgi:hypothetical protein